MSTEILGYDCDGNELYEFNIIRAIWYSDIDFKKQTNIDPRQYCVVKALDGKVYLISVYDHWNKQSINRFEGRELDSTVPIKIRPITDAENYELAFDSYNNRFLYESNLKKSELIKILNKGKEKVIR